MKNIIILGYGQIGKSIDGIYNGFGEFAVHYKDKDKETPGIEFLEKDEVDIMHVCIPYNEAFNDAVIKELNLYNPKLTIIHSTVKVGTTRNLQEATGNFIVHSPIMGVHPNLTESIKTFTKILGGIDHEAVQHAEYHFGALGIKTIIYGSPEESELSKLLSTTYYYHCINFMKHTHMLCEKYNVDFEQVYGFTNEIYNEGYEKMGMEFVKRPILKYIPGNTGGHCLVPNAEILKNEFKPAKRLLEDEYDSI